MDQCRLSLQVTFRWQLLIQTDACPAGMGGFLSIAGQIVAYWSDAISDEDCQLLGATRGDPAFQSEWALLAVWISFDVFAKFITPDLHGSCVMLRTDNTAVI